MRHPELSKKKPAFKVELLWSLAAIWLVPYLIVLVNPIYFWRNVPLLRQQALFAFMATQSLNNWTKEKVETELGPPNSREPFYEHDEWHYRLPILCSMNIRFKDNKVTRVGVRD